jgi:osmotically-inducible protein OsmY
MGKIRTLGIGAVVGGGVAYAAKRFVERSERAGRAVGAQKYGFTFWQRRGRSTDDVTLARQVESELFREESAPKGQISVNAANGVVQLRGEVEQPELIDELVQRAHSVQGVRDVENLLHLPGQEAPMHQ